MKDLRRDMNQLSDSPEFPRFTGNLIVKNAVIQNNLTILHARSIADHVKVYNRDNEPYTGKIEVDDGKVPELGDYYLRGRSLLHSAPLTTVAFTQSWFGKYGSYIVSIGLLLFAFSTAISWSYYGGRAMTYLFGVHTVIYYRIVYVIGFFLASFVDTTIVWTFSGITIAMMTIPNLIGILLLRKEMKSEVKNFWVEYATRFPGEKVPKG
jgi:AGCS family alanine or glycine:cation symporter